MYFQLVDNQVLSTQGQPDVFNLHRLTEPLDVLLGSAGEDAAGCDSHLEQRAGFVRVDVFEGFDVDGLATHRRTLGVKCIRVDVWTQYIFETDETDGLRKGFDLAFKVVETESAFNTRGGGSS
eukprot:1177632-Prorocentrum_minimum.AAC.4